MQKIDANRFFIPGHFRGSARRVNLFSDLSQMTLNKSYVYRKLVLLEAPYCKVSLIVYRTHKTRLLQRVLYSLTRKTVKYILVEIFYCLSLSGHVHIIPPLKKTQTKDVWIIPVVKIPRFGKMYISRVGGWYLRGFISHEKPFDSVTRNKKHIATKDHMNRYIRFATTNSISTVRSLETPFGTIALDDNQNLLEKLLVAEKLNRNKRSVMDRRTRGFKYLKTCGFFENATAIAEKQMDK